MELRAFVIDDNEMIRSLVSSIIELRGYEVLPYSAPLFCPIYSDRECACSQEHPCGDIFIIDKSMPYMTGLDLVENQGRNGCKGILKNKAVMSGAWTDGEIEQARKLGCQIFEKPFRIKEINKWLDECEKRIDPDRTLADLPREYYAGFRTKRSFSKGKGV